MTKHTLKLIIMVFLAVIPLSYIFIATVYIHSRSEWIGTQYLFLANIIVISTFFIILTLAYVGILTTTRTTD